MGKINKDVVDTFFMAILLFSFSTVTLAESTTTLAQGYEWVVLDEPIAVTVDDHSCNYSNDYDTFTDYKNCIFSILEQADNSRSREWGLSDKVIRKKETIYISIPNRKQPVIFEDYFEPFEEDYRTHYTLQNYDKSQGQLQLLNNRYETQSTVIVDLKTGRWQDLYATNLKFSDDMTQVVGFSGRHGMTKDIAIWERQKGNNENRYISAFASDVMYEQGEYDKKNEVYEARKITWANDKTINVDFYYRVNSDDTVAYLVRYTFKRNPSTAQWQLLQDKVQ